jgi:hypothetical protein
MWSFLLLAFGVVCCFGVIRVCFCFGLFSWFDSLRSAELYIVGAFSLDTGRLVRFGAVVVVATAAHATLERQRSFFFLRMDISSCLAALK